MKVAGSCLSVFSAKALEIQKFLLKNLIASFDCVLLSVIDQKIDHFWDCFSLILKAIENFYNFYFAKETVNKDTVILNERAHLCLFVACSWV